MVQVNVFTEALEKTQMIENAKAQVKTFQAWKRGTLCSKSEESRDNVSLSKIRRENHSPYLPWTLGTLEEDSTRGSQVEKGQQEGIPREGQRVAPRLACGYRGKTNRTEDNY